MPVETKIKYRDFVKAVEVLASNSFAKHKIINKRGTGRRFEFFDKASDKIPSKMFVSHESKFVYSGDLKKACVTLGVTKKVFTDLVSSF